MPNLQIGTLIGCITTADASGDLNETSARNMFQAGGFAVGANRIDTSPTTGQLVLLCNDTWTWDDNIGSLFITVTYD